MTDHFIKLSCENCGSGLEIYDDTDQFACGYCGSQIAVQRRGGTVVLKLGTESIPKEPAADVNLLRLKEEEENLSKRHAAMLNDGMEARKRGFIIGFSLILVGFVVVRTGYSLVMGLCILLAGIFTISYVRRHDKKVLADARELHAKIDVLNGRIEDYARLR
jgi:DNA-directed RNA polymerase subunit RPC12/RpoP